jgi:DNA-directed RNA polymerase subunit RPC12/RpoP
MPFIARQEAFTCEHCGKHVEELANGSYRNHCPFCLWSKHVDGGGPGDRASLCHGLMKPARLDQRGKKGWMINHVCVSCGKRIPNIVAPDDDIVGFSTANPQQE